MKKNKWSVEIHYPTFIRTFPLPEMKGGGAYIVNKDRSIQFMSSFLENEREAVESTANFIVGALNARYNH